MAAEMNPAIIVLLLAALCRGQSDRYLQTYPPYDETDPRTPLTFALIHSFGGSFVSSGAVAGVQVALDVINSDPELLPGYSLHYTLTDSKCSPTVSLSALFQQVLSDPSDPDDPVKIGVLGAGCSVATEATARISHFYNLAQISCSASSPELEDREQFKSYFQLLPNQADIAPAYFGVIREFEWSHVALIVQNENLFTVTMDRLKIFLDGINYDYTERIFETEEGIAGLGDEPFVAGARVFVFATFAGNARKLLCEAYTRGLRYPQYMFMTYGWFPDLWWEQQDADLNCTADQRNLVLNHTLALLQYDFPEHLNGTAATDTGLTASEYKQREEAHLQDNELDLEPLLASPYCYDATWTLVKALNLTIADLESNATLNRLAWEAQAVSTSEPFRLENFTYSNDVVRNTIFGHLEQTNFRGVSGPVLFSNLGLRKVNVRRVFQFRASKEDVTKLERVNIALVTSDGRDPESYDFEYFPNQNNTITWPRGIPYDGVPNEEVVSVSLGLAVVFFILATAGILFALACIIFNFVYRKKILVRISSPNLNYLIGVGAIILYGDIIFSVIPTTNPDAVAALCTLTPWLTAIGYSLCYGTVVVKMWRVYFIFNNPTPTTAKAPKDWMLVTVVGGLILIDITILLVYTVVEGYRDNLVAIRVPNGENMEDIEGELAIITRYFIYICDSKARDAALGVLYGYKGILQIVTLVLAFSTRKVKVKGLNDAKYILAAIYISSIVLAVIIVSTYSLKDLVNVFAAVFCTGFFIGTTVILGLVFGPKMVGLYQDPEGKQVFAKTDPTVSGADYKQSSDTENLRRRVKELEALLASQQANAASSQEKSASLASEIQPDVGSASGDMPEKPSSTAVE